MVMVSSAAAMARPSEPMAKYGPRKPNIKVLKMSDIKSAATPAHIIPR